MSSAKMFLSYSYLIITVMINCLLNLVKQRCVHVHTAKGRLVIYTAILSICSGEVAAEWVAARGAMVKYTSSSPADIVA